MKKSWLLAKRDLNSLFLNSTIAPIILVIIYLASGFFFILILHTQELPILLVIFQI
jgi:ribonucleotide reductase beta subunit family protein with ferritin-like domain